MRVRRWVRTLAALCSAVLVGAVVASSSSAFISSVSGSVLLLTTPPANVTEAGISDLTRLVAFDEQQGVTLGAPLRADWVNPGTYTGGTGQFFIPTGTVVDSHFIDSRKTPGGTNVRQGTFTFAQDILGVIGTRGKLDESDILGATGTSYGGSYPSREIDTGGSDWVQIINSRTILVHVDTGVSTDQVRVITKHNNPPTANGGGPYATVEGTSVTLAGSASDPDGDPITSITWTFVVSGLHGVSCTYTNTNMLNPTVKCNDDATVSATLKVKDAYHPYTSASPTTISVGNVPPTVTSVTLPSGQQPLAASIPVSASFTDPGTNDTHTALIDWGDTNSSAGTVNEGGHTVTGNHVYSTGGTYTVTVTVTDDDTGFGSNTGTVDIKQPPTAGAGGPYSGDEGSNVALSGTASGATSTTWAFTIDPSSDVGVTCSPPTASTLSPSVTCNDDALVHAQLTASDGVNPNAVSNTTVTFTNVAPVLGTPTGPSGPVVTNSSVSVNASFTDVGTNDTHTATIDWGDSTSPTSGSVTETNGSGTVSGSHSYTAPGSYTVQVTVTDDNGGADTSSTTILVNSPPTANAGGPYAGFEGSPATVTGATASDPDGDPLTISWTFDWTPVAVTCIASSTNTLTPSVTCNDDAVVTAHLSVSDGVYPAVTSDATINIGNVAPTAHDPVFTPTGPVAHGETVGASVSFADDGTHDTHTATIDWGDGSALDNATISETNGAGTASGSHVYNTPGNYLVDVVVTDDDGGAVEVSAFTDEITNAPPNVSAGGPYVGNEGSTITLNATASDPEGDAFTYQWVFVQSAFPHGGTCSYTGETTASPTVNCNDNGTVTAFLTTTDSLGASSSDSANVSVNNVAPGVGTIVLAPPTAPTNTNVSLATTFTDPGSHDTHTAKIDWGDGNTPAGSVSESLHTVASVAAHKYTSPGTYTVTVTVKDDDGDLGSNSTTITIT